MPDTTTTATTKTPAPVLPTTPPTVADTLRNPTLLVSRRAELLKLATERAAQLTAVARARLETVSSTVRTTAHDQLQRAASALQDLAKKIEPVRQVPAHKPPTNGVA
jgi:hypothetical protein